jgi:hypothetical protein
MVGTRGYEYDQWIGGFYDADLPKDWRFLHYSNQFRALLLPGRRTMAFLDGGLPELIEDSDAGFRFVVELPVAGLEDQGRLAALESLGERLAGIVLVQNPGLQDDMSFGETSNLLAELESKWPVCLDLGKGDERSRRTGAALAKELDLATVWRPGLESAPADRGSLLVARVGSVPLPAIRALLETLARWIDGERSAGLFFDDPRDAAEQARDCRVIAELMGI